MSTVAQTLQSLQELQPHSRQRLPDSIITGMTRSLTQARYNLIRARSNPSGPGVVIEPTNGWESLSRNTQSTRKLMTLQPTTGFMDMLNNQLLGGNSYPVLTAVLGTAAGIASFGAGLLFTVGTTALTLSQTAQRVLARAGDELWQVEEIGKVRSGASFRPVHVGSYFLVDPFRAQSLAKGWLIHEERTELTGG